METLAESGLPRWRVSSASDYVNCVHVARRARAVLVRDSKAVRVGLLAFPADAWAELVADVADGAR